ncbi:type IV toxin-antitoxin system AbiEi family antitoxin domain-containing protein [Microbacterium sp. Mu-80]|uniref:Type IV toxin-antitoxin system AbiEi family antitoxin domain-containing protein n=1 Tax=Microbacterium bandirmense TaxID=3122050 RepID=A0ABU8LBV6_9MICO
METRLEKWLAAHNGIAHSAQLRAVGFTKHQIGRAVDAGSLTRVRRSWLLSAECSPQRWLAAEVGGRVTCITAARELGLWTQTSDATVHVAVASNASRISADGVDLHWAQGPASTAPHATDEPLLNVLFQTARCAERQNAVAIWESAVRLQFVTLDELSRVRWRSTAATDVLAEVGALSDAGTETRFALIMRSCGVEFRQQAWLDGHPVDALIGERLVVQIDGYEFHRRAKDRRRDIRADARLVLQGYTVLRFDYQQVMHDPEYVRETVLRAIAQGLHRAPAR